MLRIALRPRLPVWLLLLVFFGCGPRGQEADPDGGLGDHASAKAPQNNSGAPAKPAEGKVADDDAPAAENPMIRGLEAVLESIPMDALGDSQDEMGAGLREADSLLGRIKAENLAAIREVNRQQRVAGQDSPNLILLVVPRQSLNAVGSEGAKGSGTPNLDRLRQESTRFLNVAETGSTAAATHWSLFTGRRPDGRRGAIEPDDFTLAELLWQAGYTTALIGDGSLEGLLVSSDPRSHGFDLWFGFRNRGEAEQAYPEFLWSNGARLRVLANAEAKQGESGADLVRRGIVDYLQRHYRGRPFFLYLTWAHPPDPGPTLDAVLGEILQELQSRKLHRNTVLLLVASDAESKSQEAFVVWGPGRIPDGVQSDRPCAACDILPTLADMAGASRRPPLVDGESLLPEFRKSP
ncbi:MAG: sulfatase-like hydrolase/transferase [Rhodopirellula sp.]|nr:sulfatase-like hydrolase/transferase [Rhodopirellula sp.]